MYLPDVPISVTFGALIVASNLPGKKNSSADQNELKRSSFWQVLVYGLLFHCPDSFFAFLWYPDWNLGYFLPFEKVGIVGALVLDFVGLLLLLFLGRHLALMASKRRKALVWIPIVGSFLVFAGVLGAVWDRYLHVGTFATYHAGKAALANTDPVFSMFTTLAGAYLIVPLATLLISNLIRARRQH
ncbi:MAG: hypothetical protein V1754_06210 [Pseudomonadota bacterium]